MNEKGSKGATRGQPKPPRYLLRFQEAGETQHEFVHRDDVIGRIAELRHEGVHVEAFIDAKLEIDFTIKLEGMD